MFKSKRSKNPAIRTLIGAGTCIDGNVEFSGGLHLDGRIQGDVRGLGAGDHGLWVSEEAQIDGSVVVTDIVLNGMVRGDIEAAGRVELGEKARVLGNVTYSVIETAVGAQISGKLIHRARFPAASADATDPGDSEPKS